jgi:hypothetical protein
MATTAEARRLTGNGNIRRCTVRKLPPKGGNYYSKTLAGCSETNSLVATAFATGVNNIYLCAREPAFHYRRWRPHHEKKKQSGQIACLASALSHCLREGNRLRPGQGRPAGTHRGKRLNRKSRVTHKNVVYARLVARPDNEPELQETARPRHAWRRGRWWRGIDGNRQENTGSLPATGNPDFHGNAGDGKKNPVAASLITTSPHGTGANDFVILD